MADLHSNPLPVALLDEDGTHVFANAEQVLAKLTDTILPGFQAEFDPMEAEFAGAFVEDALSEADARESASDVAPVLVPPLAG